MGKIVDWVSALLCIGAGAYLLQYHEAVSSGTGTSWFQIIGHGMGIYFLGRGLWIARAAYLQGEANDLLDKISAWHAYTAHRSGLLEANGDEPPSSPVVAPPAGD